MVDWDTGVEVTASPVSLMEMLKQVPDPRSLHGLRHPLSALLGLTVVAVLAGMRGPEAIAQFGRDHGWPLLKHLGFRRKKGPCKATLSNLYRALDVEAFEMLLRRWIFARCPELKGQVVLDGKTLRGSRDGEAPGVHLLSLYATEVHAVIAQWAVDGKTNEHKAALEQLGVLSLEGMVISGDAMFCHRDWCQTVRDAEGDYLVFVKDNQPTLQRDIALALGSDESFSPLHSEAAASSPPNGHDRQ
jgi:predicted transposase YbfD/YdcC